MAEVWGKRAKGSVPSRNGKEVSTDTVQVKALGKKKRGDVCVES